MTQGDERDGRLSSFNQVPIVASTGNSGPGDVWRCLHIYRWHGQAIEAWAGPSALGPEAPPARQLKQGTSEIAFLDLGGSRTLGRRTGTVLGELLSFEQNDPGIFPWQRAIEIRHAIKQRFVLHKTWATAELRRDGDVPIALFRGDSLRLDSSASQAEGVIAMLIHSSQVLRCLDIPLPAHLSRSKSRTSRS